MDSVDSLNVPVPGAVRRLAADLLPELSAFDRVRDRPGLVCKRFEGRVDRVAVREALAGAPAFEARLDGLGTFTEPPAGPTPVVYLAVESPGLVAAHRRLCEAFPPAEGVEGDAYVPHVTLARGGNADAAAALAGRSVGPVTWTANELVFWDGRHGGPAGTVRLPV